MNELINELLQDRKAEHLMYGLMLLLCGAGWMLLLLRRHTEMDNRSSFSGILRFTVKRIADTLPDKSHMAGKVREYFRASRRKKLELEIYDGSLLLKNLALVEKERAFSADYLYEKLMEHSRRLKPVYATMLSLYRSGRDRDAFQYLAEQCGTRTGRNFSMVLAKADQIHPQALVEQMEVFQEILRQQRMTEEMKRIQRKSLITTVLASAAVFVMVIDFAVVVVFMHTMTLMESVF